MIQGSQHDAQRVGIPFDALDPVQRHKLLRDLPLYCDTAVPRPTQMHPETVRTIGLFRLGKSRKDLKAMEAVVGILLDREAYDRAPFSEKKLANELSKFLWHFKGRLDFEMWQLMEHNFSMQFVLQKPEFPFLIQYLQAFIDQLKSEQGPVPFCSLEKAQYFLRSQLRAASALQRGGVAFKRSILEEQLRAQYNLRHGEYIPFDECLFLAWQKKTLRLSDVSSEEFHFEQMNVPESHAIFYDDQTKILTIHEQVVKLARTAKQKNLARVLADDELLGREWLFDEIIEEIDKVQSNETRRTSYDNAAYQLNENIRRQAGIENFLIKTSKSVKINPQYLS